MYRISSIAKRLAYATGFEVSRRHGNSGGVHERALSIEPFAELRSFLRAIAGRGFAPTRILDVGANSGTWTRVAREVFPDALFLLIEPQPEMRAQLNKLCIEFPSISWVEAAVGSSEHEALFTIWEDLAGSSFLWNADPALIASGRQRKVLLRTLDDVLLEQNFCTPELAKLDIQGLELEALQGATTLLGTTELFILEVSLFPFLPGMPIFKDVVRFMSDWGYEMYDIVGALRRPSDGSLGQLDVAFARHDGVLRYSNAW